jgi:WD40 repeat protein
VTILKIVPGGTTLGIETVYYNSAEPGPIYTVSWSPDGIYLAFGGQDQTVQVWEALTGRHIFTYRGFVQQRPDSGIQQVAWSPNGSRIVAVSYGEERSNSGNSVQVWDALNGGHVYSYTGHLDKVGSVAWSPDGRYLVTGSADTYDPTVQVWLDQR